LANLEVDLLPAIEPRLALAATTEELTWLDKLRGLITEVDPYSGALLARNPYNTEFWDVMGKKGGAEPTAKRRRKIVPRRFRQKIVFQPH